ncbi:MAG: glycosyltransferase family 9 protein [Segetibacter sp.]|nr:glycosyltransferase family 9 protein [Segetibacter sp.]
MELQEQNIKKIVLFRALQLGDLLCSIPAIRALRNGFPDAEITLVCLPWAKFLAERFPNYFNSFISFPGYPGLPEQTFNAKDFTSFIHNIQNQKYDLSIQLHGNGTIANPLVGLFDAKLKAGFYKQGHYQPDPSYFIDYPSQLPEVLRHIKLMEHLGLKIDDRQMEFPLIEKDYNDLEEAGLGLYQGKYVCIHPGSRGEERRWSPEYFAALADYCIERGFKVVVTGTKDEAAIVENVINRMKNQPINAAGKTTLGAIGVLIKNAFALVSNCTGVSHIASALKIRSIVISLDGEPERWAPLNKELHTTIDWTTTNDFNAVLKVAEELLTNTQPA